MSKTPDKVAMENVNIPGRVERVDAEKYNAKRCAILTVLPASLAGLTVAKLKQRLLPLLPEDLFPGGAKAGWWLKGVQLDLEAKGLIGQCPGAGKLTNQGVCLDQGISAKRFQLDVLQTAGTFGESREFL